MEDEVGAVEGRLSLSEVGEVVAFKLCLGAVWGRSTVQYGVLPR